MPENGYPTDAELEKVASWPLEKGDVALMDYVKSLWRWPDWGWEQKGYSYYISTGGWSGNESIISAMHQLPAFWSICWVSSRAGGHYRFHIPKVFRKPKGEGA